MTSSAYHCGELAFHQWHMFHTLRTEAINNTTYGKIKIVHAFLVTGVING